MKAGNAERSPWELLARRRAGLLKARDGDPDFREVKGGGGQGHLPGRVLSAAGLGCVSLGSYWSPWHPFIRADYISYIFLFSIFLMLCNSRTLQTQGEATPQGAGRFLKVVTSRRPAHLAYTNLPIPAAVPQPPH